MTRIFAYILVIITLCACQTTNSRKQPLLSANQTVLNAKNDSSIKMLAMNCEFVRNYVENNMKYYNNKYKDKTFELFTSSHTIYQYNDTIIGLLANSNCYKGMIPDEIIYYIGKPSKSFNQLSGFIQYWFYDKHFENYMPTVRFYKPKDTIIDNFIIVPYYGIDH